MATTNDLSSSLPFQKMTYKIILKGTKSGEDQLNGFEIFSKNPRGLLVEFLLNSEIP